MLLYTQYQIIVPSKISRFVVVASSFALAVAKATDAPFAVIRQTAKHAKGAKVLGSIASPLPER
jgi:hypothetical protein